MSRRLVGLVVVALICWGAMAGSAVAADRGTIRQFGPGAPGIGDPYFPLDGNGGYDVRHYDLDVRYEPSTDVLSGVATIRARATQNLSSFNLDLVGLNVRYIAVDRRRASWSRDGGELTIIPRRKLFRGERFRVFVVYDGVPEPIGDSVIGVSGFLHTDDGTVVAGQPDVAATWYPVNDHPADKASYRFRIDVPQGLEAVANGELRGSRTSRGRTTWIWDADEPMASYLTTATIGEFDLNAYRQAGIRYWDAIDPDLFTPPEPRTGQQFAISQKGEPAFKRLARTISVPADGAQLSFWVIRDTEANWDHLFVEAHPVGSDDWTTLPDLNGHTSDSTGLVCPYWLGLHPFLGHYQTDNGDGTCSPTGTTGEWWAASGSSGGYEQWAVDLSDYAGSEVEVSISYASDDLIQMPGVFVDDVVVSNGPGSTSFEADGDTFDGWTVPGAPEGSAPNPNDWIVGTADDAPPPTGEIVAGSFARQPEIIAFLSESFGPYPFSAAGGIVDDTDELSFALENQTRPVYAKTFFSSAESGDSVVVHELAHQWFGDSLALERWQHIWLNEGFATYAEWLWSEREGLGTAQEIFDSLAAIPADDPFWALTIGDPGPEQLLDGPVYDRGAMTLHALRVLVGDEIFFSILRRWAQSRAGDNVTTPEFIRLAERISGQDLGAFFQTWLFTPAKPPGIEPAATLSRALAAAPEALRRSPVTKR
jgi:hypothetical protein